MILLLALPAAASSCVPWPLPFVMGYADAVDVTPEGALHVAWREPSAKEAWPPVAMILADSTEPGLPDLVGRRVIPLIPGRPLDPTDPSPSAVLRPAEPLPVGSEWRVYADRDPYWSGFSKVRVVATLPTPSWHETPDIATRGGGDDAMTRRGYDALEVPGASVAAPFLAAWVAPLDYTRPPDFVAAVSTSTTVGTYGLCEPTLMVIPVSAADDLRFGLRPFYAWGRWGPPVEVTLGEARARRTARIKEDRDRRVSACTSRREPAMAAWRSALEVANAALLNDKPGCIAAIDQVDAELASCVGRPAYERVRAVDHVVDTLTTVHTLADAIAALEAGASLPPAWRADTDAAAICAEVPLDARAGPW